MYAIRSYYHALATIPENLAGVASSLSDPLGMSVGDTSSLATAAEQQAVNVGTFGAMGKLFDGKRNNFV